jgi:HEPN domain-containing protein
MRKNELLDIAHQKYRDATLLFENGGWSNSYYLYGYAVEILLKARISTFFKPDTIPDKRFVNDVYSHNLDRLADLAQLSDLILKEMQCEQEFARNWTIVREWSEAVRYDIVSQSKSEAMHIAMTDTKIGVYRWLQQHCS